MLKVDFSNQKPDHNDPEGNNGPPEEIKYLFSAKNFHRRRTSSN